MYTTKQELFDAAINHLRTMPRQSFDEVRETCMYRGPDGAKCIIGALIPDDCYERRFDYDGEDNSINASNLPRTAIPMSEELNTSETWRFLNRMQFELHDQTQNWGPNGFIAWGAVAALAASEGLTFNA